MDAAWQRIVETLGGRHRSGESGPDWLGLLVDAGGARTPVVVKRGVRAGTPCLVLAAAVVSAADVSEAPALRYNAGAEHGCLALEDGTVSLRWLAQLDADVDEIDATIRGMAREAARLRRRLRAMRGRPQPFSGYAE